MAKAKKKTAKKVTKKVAKKTEKKTAKKVAKKTVKKASKVTKKVAKKTAKKVAAKVTKKKTAKKVTKKAAAKPAAKKVTKKVTAPQKSAPAKKEAKKKVEKTTAKKTTGMTAAEKKEFDRLEAIRRYRERNKIEIDADLIESELEDDEAEDTPVQESLDLFGADEEVDIDEKELPLDELSESSDGFEAGGEETPGAVKLSEEYNPEDDDDAEEGNFGYGWGYNDAFDKPDDEEESPYLDEDELYAQGLDEDDDR